MIWASLVAQRVKRLPVTWETQVRSLSREDLLEKGMVAHSSIPGLEHPTDRGIWQATIQGVTKCEDQARTKSIS